MSIEIKANVKYRIKNVDLGTYLELRELDGSFVMRPEKDDGLQFFVFEKGKDSTDKVVYKMKAAPYEGQAPALASSIFQADIKSKAATLEEPNATFVSQWVIAGPNLKEGRVYIYVDTGKDVPALLQVNESNALVVDTNAAIKNSKYFTRVKLDDNYKWEVKQVNDPKIPEGDNQNYRIRTLLGSVLEVDANGGVDIEHGDNSTCSRHWTIVPAPGNGYVTIFNVETKKYLSAKDKGDHNWVVATSTDKDIWQIDPTSSFTYSIDIARQAYIKGRLTTQTFSLAVGQGKAILKPKKPAHNQIWLLEPENADFGDGEADEKPGTDQVAKGLAVGKYKIRNTSATALYLNSYDNGSATYCWVNTDGSGSYYNTVFQVDKYNNGAMIYHKTAYFARSVMLVNTGGAPALPIQSSPYMWKLVPAKKPKQFYIVDSATGKALFSPQSAGTAPTLANKEEASMMIWEFISV
jgi:hypothetical protein